MHREGVVKGVKIVVRLVADRKTVGKRYGRIGGWMGTRLNLDG